MNYCVRLWCCVTCGTALVVKNIFHVNFSQFQSEGMKRVSLLRTGTFTVDNRCRIVYLSSMIRYTMFAFQGREATILRIQLNWQFSVLIQWFSLFMIPYNTNFVIISMKIKFITQLYIRSSQKNRQDYLRVLTIHANKLM